MSSYEREQGLEVWTHEPDRYRDPDVFDLNGFLRVFTSAVRHHKRIIAAAVALTLLAAILYVILFPPVYLVQAQLAAERDLDPSRDVFYANWQVFRKADARDEIVLFESGPVLRQVIEKNDLTYDDVHHTFVQHVGYLWRKSWPGQAYRGVKDFVMPPAIEVTPELEDRGRTLDGLKAGVHIAGEQDSYIATVTVKGPRPDVHLVANSLIDTYLDFRRERFATEARDAVEALSLEADRAREQLDDIVARREAFAAENGLLVEFQKETQDVRELTLAETRMADLRSQIAALEASLAEVERQLTNEPREMVLSSVQELNSTRETARLRRLELEAALIGMRNRYREDSPEVQDVLTQIRELEELIQAEPERIDRSVTAGINGNYQQLAASRDQLRSELAGVYAALGSTQRSVATLRERLNALPSVMERANDLNREYGVAAEKYQRLLLRRVEAEVSATAVDAAPASVRVLEYAAPATGKHWPRLKYLLPGALIFGLGLGVVAAVLRSLTAGRLLRIDVDRGRVVGPVYGTVAVGGRVPPLTLTNGRGNVRANGRGNGRRNGVPSLPAPDAGTGVDPSTP